MTASEYPATGGPDEPEALDPASRIFAELLERYHRGEGDPAAWFADYPQHASSFHRWWQNLRATGEVSPARTATERERFGAYRIVADLGRGSQGSVHLAIDTRNERRVALKLLPQQLGNSTETWRRLEREAALLTRLRDPGICEVLETGVVEGRAFLAMRHVEGENLAARLQRARTEGVAMPVADALECVERIARALHKAHEAGLVHRDIKPGNIMIGVHGQPVVLDFGLARAEDDGQELTRTGELLGTPAYMSPEQLAASRIPLDARSDIWSLGVTLFEALTLHRPFQAPTEAQTYERILVGGTPDARRLRPELTHDVGVVLATALAKDRAHRYQRALDFAEDLRCVRHGERIQARSPGALVWLWRWARRRPAVAISLGAAFLSLLVGTVVSAALYVSADRALRAQARLADVVALREVLGEEARLPAPAPQNVALFAHWIDERAGPLVQRLPLHRARLAELIARAGEYGADDRERDLSSHPARQKLLATVAAIEQVEQELRQSSAEPKRTYLDALLRHLESERAELEQVAAQRRTFRVDDDELAYELETLQRLVAELEALASPGGLLARVQARLHWASEVVAVTVEQRAGAWREACEFVRASAVYGHRELRPQPGLVPLGVDPESQLVEFAHPRSGTIATRDVSTGRIAVQADTGIVFVLVPSGRFLEGGHRVSGQDGYDADTPPDEAPEQVDMEWFFIAKHELTRGQWQRLTGAVAPGPILAAMLQPDPAVHPAGFVTWPEASLALQREGLALPTESQWEYAARAGTTTPSWNGDVLQLRGLVNARDASYFRLLPGRQRGVAFDDGHALTASVDSFAPNPWGLHHVLGNVAEWCADLFNGRFPVGIANETREEGALMPEFDRRSVRGGSFRSLPSALRCAARAGRDEDNRAWDIGVRPVRRVDP